MLHGLFSLVSRRYNMKLLNMSLILRASVIMAIFIKINKVEGLDLNFVQNDYQVKFERAVVIRYNKSMMKELSIKTFKFNRTTAAINVTWTTKIDMGCEVEGIIQAYKFMSNEYRFFPVHFAINFCLAFSANLAGLTSGAHKCGNVKEIKLMKDKEYYVCNWHPDQSKLPPYIPDGQYKLEIQILRYSEEVAVLDQHATVFRPIGY